MSTESHGRRLAPAPRSLRDRITVRPAGITKAIAERRRRVAWCELWSDYPGEKPWFVADQQRTDTSGRPLPDERQHRLIHEEGIARGFISRERIIRYRATQLLDDLTAFPSHTPANERLLAVMLREVGEAVEKHVVAEGTPSVENCADAVREGREAIALLELRNAALERGIVS